MSWCILQQSTKRVAAITRAFPVLIESLEMLYLFFARILFRKLLRTFRDAL